MFIVNSAQYLSIHIVKNAVARTYPVLAFYSVDSVYQEVKLLDHDINLDLSKPPTSRFP